MGRPLPGVKLEITDGELILAIPPPTPPSSWPIWTGRPPPRTARGPPATGSRQDEDGYLYFEGRTDDVIISAGYRIGPFEVESALVSHAGGGRGGGGGSARR